MQKRIVSEVGILKPAAMVKQYDKRRGKTDVIEARPPEGSRNQSVLEGQRAPLFAR
jgi:hypothetical protein